jgi:hypothetical protein
MGMGMGMEDASGGQGLTLFGIPRRGGNMAQGCGTDDLRGFPGKAGKEASDETKDAPRGDDRDIGRVGGLPGVRWDQQPGIQAGPRS